MSSLTSLIDQSIYTVPSFTLECGVELHDVPVAYKTWGTLNSTGSNVMIICHAFTGSADVEDWWGPLMGPRRAFDPRCFFIICLNVLGSPYGTASPISTNPHTGKLYGPEFPPTTIRDDVRLQKHVLDFLGVKSIFVAVGGSMGGMAVLEWPLCTPTNYVKHIIPLATSARHSAWCISWGEAQRQAIYSDPDYAEGWYYDHPGKGPKSGLAAARMSALLTYRSRDSFEGRFGRKTQETVHRQNAELTHTPHHEHNHTSFAVHNDGNLSPRSSSSHSSGPPSPSTNKKVPIFSAQSYLRYQGAKFTSRFDANCYIHITRKMDTHDLARGREELGDEEQELSSALSRLPPALVISIASDGLFTPSEQRFIAANILDSRLVVIPSADGHDGFLLEFQKIGEAIKDWLGDRAKNFSDIDWVADEVVTEEDYTAQKTSVFGEVEVDVVSW